MNASVNLLTEASDEEVFQELTKPNGGRMPWRVLAPGVAAWFSVWLKRARQYIAAASRAYPDLPPVFCDFSHNPEVNAYAYPVYKGRHVIEVFAGAPLVLSALFKRMLAEPGILAHVPDAAAERPGLPRFVGFRPNAEQMAEFGLPPIGPVSPERRSYAYHLMRIGVDYLTVHELTHIVHGHADYANAELGLSAVMELGCRPLNGEESIIRQTLEMDADTFAVASGLRTIHYRVIGKEPLIPALANYYRDPEQAFFDWAFATYVYFRMFGHPPFRGQKLETLSHPPDGMRTIMALATGEQYLQKNWDPALIPAFDSAVRRAAAEAERAFWAVTNQLTDSGGLIDAASPDGEAHFVRLVACWKDTVRPRLLAEYSYTDRLPA